MLFGMENLEPDVGFRTKVKKGVNIMLLRGFSKLWKYQVSLKCKLIQNVYNSSHRASGRLSELLANGVVGQWRNPPNFLKTSQKSSMPSTEQDVRKLH